MTRAGEKCNAQVRSVDGSLYCRPDHDPAYTRSTDPAIFRMPNLRTSRRDVVLEYRDGRDMYTDRLFNQSMELDHALELHMLRDTFDMSMQQCGRQSGGVTDAATDAATSDLAVTLKQLANAKENLNFTSPAINQLKFEALYDYSGQYKAGQDMPSLVSFLNKDSDTGIQLSRKVTSRIQEGILSAYDHICGGMRHEVPVFDFFEHQLHDLVVVKMQLK